MSEKQITLETLFQKLGLASDEKDMDLFVDQHQLAIDVKLNEAPFWNDQQRQFLQTNQENGGWIIIIDLLNELLHENE